MRKREREKERKRDKVCEDPIGGVRWGVVSEGSEILFQKLLEDQTILRGNSNY